MIVPAIGPLDAKICLIGEAPGKQEWEQGQPFIGPSGNLLMAILRKHGISRSEVRLTNVIKDRTTQDPLVNIPKQELHDLITMFWHEIQQTNCNVYVPMGNTALYAMTGNTNISLWRNSILVSPISHGMGGMKVIPTFHPAAALRDTSLYDLILNDFMRIVEESESPIIDLPQPKLITNPTAREAIDFIHRIHQEGKPFAFDVETPYKPPHFVLCISFANNTNEAMSIWLFDERCYYNREDFVAVYLAIKAILEDPLIEKGGHNVAYDIIALRQHGINVSPPYFDTMHKHHACDPIASKHSLAFLCSVLTRQPFYKEWDVVEDATITDLETYNAVDSLRTIESNQALDGILGKRTSFYTRHYKNLLPNLIEMFDNGLLVDSVKRNRLANETKVEIHQREKTIAEKLGLKKFNASSSKQVQHVVYDILKCKPRYKKYKGKKVLTADEETLCVLYQDEPIDILMDIRDSKEQAKLLTFLEPKTKGALAKRRGDVIRTEYKPMTKTGRLSSSASTATGIGLNLQAQPKKVREIFVPRPGYIFMGRDLPQAEAQITAADAENEDLLHYFELSKGERGRPKNEKQYDVHRKNASLSLSKPQSEVVFLEREACKRVVHGTNYGMEAKRQQLTLLKELKDDNGKPLWTPLREVERRRQNYLNSDPSILERQSRIREELYKYRRLINSFGRTITFHEIINDPDVLYYFGQRDYSEIFRTAYAWTPQSTIADMISLALVEINDQLKREGLGRVALQVHDELVMEIKDDYNSILRANIISGDIMSRPVIVRGHELSIFPDIKLGYTWMFKHECELDEQLEELYGRVRMERAD